MRATGTRQGVYPAPRAISSRTAADRDEAGREGAVEGGGGPRAGVVAAERAAAAGLRRGVASGQRQRDSARRC